MNVVRIAIDDVSVFWWRALNWAVNQQTGENGFVAALNNNGIAYPNDPFRNRLFVGAKRVIPFSGNKSFQDLYAAHSEHPSFLVGYFGYDLKNQLEVLSSRNPNRLGFLDIYFVEPEWIIDFESDAIEVKGYGDTDDLMRQLTADVQSDVTHSFPAMVQCRVTSDEYQANVRRIQQHIREGDVYELNYCIEFFAENLLLNPLATYQALSQRSPMPFSNFLKLGERYVVGASPERFLKKEGRTVVSQPIKGTIRRGSNEEEDAHLRNQLLNSEKERAENLMIVDLVRNDLARSAITGSIKVDELFGIYGFQQVYQMISTVSATLREDMSWAQAVERAFPMGSMTGAPKIRAMELIDELEVSRRGLYSGAVGYVTPDGNFDFSVVIRTLLYNAQSRYASFSVGSAITYDSNPAEEWEECLLKARAIREILENNP
ncbi:aminodeoxychorismate synthase component I [Spirosoma sp.]|uniref:aminodeoxychorismate synthase component I n=1 Tax=Spirosoma sp. TaxID=1899569 RepID=UPI003B3B6448